MTTATKQAPETEDTSTPSLGDVEEWEERLGRLREQLTELRERESALQDATAEAIATGDEPEELREERREVRELIRDLEAAEPVLEARIRDGREAACRALAEDRIAEIKKKIGGLRGEQPRHLERAREAREKYLDAIGKALEARPRAEHLRLEASALAERFGLELPEGLNLPAGPNRDGELDGIPRLTEWPDVLDTPRRSLQRKKPSVRMQQALRVLRQWDEDSPSPDIFETAGAWSDEEWEIRRARKADERAAAARRKQQQKIERALDLLRDMLSDGPAQKEEVHEAAREAGIEVNRERGLSGAKRQLDVRAVEPITDAVRPPVYFALPDRWDENEFQPVSSSTRLGRLG